MDVDMTWQCSAWGLYKKIKEMKTDLHVVQVNSMK